MPEHQPPKSPRAAPKKETPRHIADLPVDDAEASDPGVKSPVTGTGLPVEEQVRKEWDPKRSGGLPTGMRAGRR